MSHEMVAGCQYVLGVDCYSNQHDQARLEVKVSKTPVPVDERRTPKLAPDRANRSDFVLHDHIANPPDTDQIYHCWDY